MRLLLRSDTGEFSFTNDLVGDDTIPPYAILSHTWGANAEEVTFEDLTNGTGKDKPGYEKIRFCGEQARQDDLQYFWIADSALQGAPLSQFSVDERLSWIERRRTKLEEDKAYSLLGIFDVSMPLIYGEGRERAFKRLRKEIDSITADIA
jgi:hypothetical protein